VNTNFEEVITDFILEIKTVSKEHYVVKSSTLVKISQAGELGVQFWC
jgi:hypothetical protein